MPFEPETTCGECGYGGTIKTDTCPGCGERIRRRSGGFRGLLRSILFLLIALYVLFSAFKDFDFGDWRW